jgi:hypothetical protein
MHSTSAGYKPHVMTRNRMDTFFTDTARGFHTERGAEWDRPPGD